MFRKIESDDKLKGKVKLIGIGVGNSTFEVAHFKKFYNDTAVYGNTPALMCAYEYFVADHLLFGTDAPLGPRWGMVEDTITSIERLTIPAAEKEKILKNNAVNLFKLAL